MNLSISSLLSNLLIKIVSSTPLESLALCQTVHLKCAKSLQSCLTLCNPMNCSLPGSSIHGILQARILEGLPCPPPGDLPNPGIEPVSLMSPALAGGFFTTEPVGWGRDANK